MPPAALSCPSSLRQALGLRPGHPADPGGRRTPSQIEIAPVLDAAEEARKGLVAGARHRTPRTHRRSGPRHVGAHQALKAADTSLVRGSRGAQRRVDHRHRDRAVQVVAVADEDVVLLLVNLDVQVTCGPAAGPTSPWAASRTRIPSPTPAGILTLISRRARTRPSPPHRWHGSGMTSPTPRQVGHGRDVITWPSSERCTLWTSPRPPQVSQATGPSCRWCLCPGTCRTAPRCRR